MSDTNSSTDALENKMGSLEIERKYLLDRLPPDLDTLPSCEIQQGYLVAGDDFEARIRKKDEHFYLTIKQGSGRTRHETEIALSAEQYVALWPLTKGKRIEKRRFYRRIDPLVIEYDVYAGTMEGLFVAEIEFPTEEACESFVPPVPLGQEITGDMRYANKNLALSGVPGSH